MNEVTLYDNLFNTICDVLPDFETVNFLPDTDMKEGKDAYTLEMDLPGLNEKDVNLELDRNVLTISSRKEENKEEKSRKDEDSKWIMRERRTSEFKRQFALPEDAIAENATATFRNGVLSVRLPRKELPSPKRIAIEAA